MKHLTHMFRKGIISILLVFSVMLAAEAQTGTWSGKLDIQGSKLSVVFHLDAENPVMDSPDQGVRGIPIQVERSGAGKIVISIPSIGARYEGIWMLKQIAGTFSQMNLSLPLMLTPGENKPKRPQTPSGPFPYTTEEVSFTNGETRLYGTLVLPEGHSRQTPALIMVTGSGQQNRDEEIFDHKPFAVIADALARKGIASLRYDDRGYSGYEGNISECTVEDFMNDALAGIDLLKEQFDEVGVIGHSEGGTIAMMLAAAQKVDFAISLAGMAVSGAETLIWQNRIALSQAGVPEETIETYLKLLSGAFEAAIYGTSMPEVETTDLPDALKRNYLTVTKVIQTPYMRHFLGLDIRSRLNRITCPVLALNGTKDIQVEPESNLGAIRSALSDRPNSTIQTVEGVNHLFQHCNTGSASEYKEIEETFAPEVLDMIVSWILPLVP